MSRTHEVMLVNRKSPSAIFKYLYTLGNITRNVKIRCLSKEIRMSVTYRQDRAACSGGCSVLVTRAAPQQHRRGL